MKLNQLEKYTISMYSEKYTNTSLWNVFVNFYTKKNMDTNNQYFGVTAFK